MNIDWAEAEDDILEEEQEEEQNDEVVVAAQPVANETVEAVEPDLLQEDDEQEALQVIEFETDLFPIAKDEPVIDERRCTLPILSKFERAKIIGVRAEQIAQGAQTLIDLEMIQKHYKCYAPDYIFHPSFPINAATVELEQRKIPIVVRRRFANNAFEDWTLDELQLE